MMKTNRVIILMAVAISATAFTSCRKQDTPAGNKDGLTKISATIEQAADEGTTRTYLGDYESGKGYPVLWTENDSIAVSSQSASGFNKYKLTSGKDQMEGTFVPASEGVTGAAYAYYPYSRVGSVDNGQYYVTIPDTQNYKEGSFGNEAMPMYAKADDLAAGLTFSPLMSVLKLQLTGSCTISKIYVTSYSQKLSGAATIDMSNGTITFDNNAKKTVTLDCGSGVTLDPSNPKIFCISLPASTEAQDYTVTISSNESLGMSKTMKSKTFTAKKIKKMESMTVTNDAPIYVDLKSGAAGAGIKLTGNESINKIWWAPFNVGATRADEYSTGCDNNLGLMKAANRNKACPDGWTSALDDEYKLLVNNATSSANPDSTFSVWNDASGLSVAGRRFYGHANYTETDSYIFFPAAGFANNARNKFDVGTSGYYCSSARTTYNYTFLTFASNGAYMNNNTSSNNSFYYSVRCIKK